MIKKRKILILEFLILLIACSFYRGLLLGMLWVILHETAHVLIGLKYKVDIYGIHLNLTGAKVDMNAVEELLDKQKIILYLAGPLTNFLIALVLLFLQRIIISEWISISFYLNLILFIFNLLPAYPLDGGRIYEIMLSRRFLYKKSKIILVNISFLVSGILILLFFLTFYIHKANVSLLLSAVLIAYSTYLEKKNMMYIVISDLYKKRSRLRRFDFIENRNISMYYKSTLVKGMSLVDKNRFNSFYVLNEGLKVLGIVYEDELIEAIKKYGNITFNEYLELKNER